MPKLLNIFIIIELVAFIASFFLLRSDKNKFWKLSILYLFIVCSVEITGRVLSRVYYLHNTWLYTIFILFEGAYIIYGMYYFLKDYKKVKLLTLFSYGIFCSIYILEIYLNGIMGKNTLPIMFLSIVAILYSLWYYYLLLKKDEFVDLKKHAPFWWVAGTLLFYFGGVVITLFDPVFPNKIYAGHTLRYFIFILLNLLLYGFWTYAFICRNRQRRYIS